MKKLCSLLLIVFLMLSMCACNTDDILSEDEIRNIVQDEVLSEDEIRSIVQGEVAKIEQPTIDEDKITQKVIASIKEEQEFAVGETLISPVGSNFKMYINSEKDNKYATITTFKVTALKVADINDKNDYYGKYNNLYEYYRYIYQLELSGKVDASFAGRTMRIQVAFDDKSDAMFYDVMDNAVKIKSDGTFSVNTRIGSNKVEKYIYPHLLWFLY